MADERNRDDDATQMRNVPQDTPPSGYPTVPDDQATQTGQGPGDQPTRVGMTPPATERPTPPGGQETVVHGEWRGRIVRAPRGSGGFGYDPIFVPDGEQRTSAELTPQEKDAASHRGRAMRALLPYLRELA